MVPVNKMAVKHNFPVCLELIFAAVFVLNACSSIETGRNIPPAALETDAVKQYPFSVGKALYDYSSGTFYLLEESRPYVYFYRDDKQINQIGGLGMGSSNFQKLSDIALDPDGNLLTLDSFACLIRKFSPDGKWIADTKLSSFSQPAKFCCTPDGDLLIYDASRQEISKINGLDGKVIFTFGRFEIDSVSQLNCCRDYIVVVDGDASSSLYYSSLGRLLQTLEHQAVIDQYQNLYTYENGALRVSNSDLILPCGWRETEARLFVAERTLLLVSGNSVLTIRPVYQRSQT